MGARYDVIDPVARPWTIEHVFGTADEVFLGDRSSATLLQSSDVPASLRFVRVAQRTIVLGSSQPPEVLALPLMSDVDVVNRRSGGGAVWLDPHEQVWVDVIVPGNHKQWVSDVARSFDWLGNVWVQTLRELGIATSRIAIHRGAMQTSAWSDLLCFAGKGPGEVFVDGRKIVGMSQRRSRTAALFQCGLLLHWVVDPSMFSADARTGRDERDVELVGMGLDEALGRSVTSAEVERCFIDKINRLTVGDDR